jgi:hypothetical protein
MKLSLKSSRPAAGSPNFDDLRARLEGEIARPAVIAVASSTSEDGKDIAGRGLAHSLAIAGYSTLLVDTRIANRGQVKFPQGLGLDEIVAQLSTPSAERGSLASLALSDPSIQRTTSQRVMGTALAILRQKFEYVVINTEFGSSPTLTTSVVTSADAVLVTVQTGRREKTADAKLSALLGRIGPRFLGVVAIDKSVIRSAEPAYRPDAALLNERRTQTSHVERERRLREIVNSPT